FPHHRSLLLNVMYCTTPSENPLHDARGFNQGIVTSGSGSCANRSSSRLVGIANRAAGGLWGLSPGRCRHAQPGPRGLRPRGKTEEVMGNATRTMTVVAALFWLSVAPSFGQTPTAAPTPNPCSSKNCSGNAALSGLS